MIGFVKALVSGFLALAGTASSLVYGAWMLWSVGSGEITGWLAVVMVPVGAAISLVGLGFLAMVGDAMDKWDGGR